MCGAPGGATGIGQESRGWEPEGQRADRKHDGAKDSVRPAGHEEHFGGSDCL